MQDSEVDLVLRIDEYMPLLAPEERELEGFVDLQIASAVRMDHRIVAPEFEDLNQHVLIALDSYWAGTWCRPQERSCARAVCTSRLLAMVQSLGCGGRQANVDMLSKMCAQLRAFLKKAPFSANSWSGSSRFEKVLFMCLAAFENTQSTLLSTNKGRPWVVRCESETNELAYQTLYRDSLDSYDLMPAGLTKDFYRMFPGGVPVSPGADLRLYEISNYCFYIFGFIACAEAAARLGTELYLLNAGMIDTPTFLKDIAERAVVFGLHYADPLNIGASVAFWLGCLDPAQLAGNVLHGLDTCQLGGWDRVLHCAYQTLQLSPEGIGSYSPEYLERHLAFLLDERPLEAVQFLAAYMIIQEMQFETLQDPFAEVDETDSQDESDGEEAWTDQAALSVLGFPADANPTPQEIRRRWLKLCLQHHPDKGGSAEEFQRLSGAHKHFEGR